MSEPITIRTRKFMSNRLLNRKQMILDVIHPNRATVSKSDLKNLLAKKFNVQDESTIFVFGFRTAFGGGRSTGFALVYDGIEDALANEPIYRLIRQGLKEKKTGSRKSRKELKNRRKRVRGTKKMTIGA